MTIEIVDFPMTNGGFSSSPCDKLPEGIFADAPGPGLLYPDGLII